MQADPIKPTLKAPGTKRLRLKHDELLSRFAFKFKLRRCDKDANARVTSSCKLITETLLVSIVKKKVGSTRSDPLYHKQPSGNISTPS